MIVNQPGKAEEETGSQAQRLPFKCNEQLRRHIERNLKDFDFQKHEEGRLKQAAVAITVVGIDGSSLKADISSFRVQADDAAVILTRRSSLLKHHPGQWAIPGGQLDDGESPEDTALRELEEEVHLALPKDRILGRLDDFTTRSGYIMTPIVVWGGPDADLTPNPQEVHSVHRVPVKELLRRDAPILEACAPCDHPILYMPLGNRRIASPTAALLYQFREVAMLGNTIRVAHYEQPLFAWR